MSNHGADKAARVVRPLIQSKPVDEFGEAMQELEECSGANVRDLSYVPGFSDLKFQRDLALAEVAQGRRLAQDVPALPVNVRMVRRAGVSGTFQGQKLMAAANDGYQPITKEHLGQDWFTELPPGSRVLEDGTIVNAAGDCQYMYCTGPVAARNLRRKQQRMAEMADSAGLNPVDADGNSTGGIVQAGGTFAKVSK